MKILIIATILILAKCEFLPKSETAFAEVYFFHINCLKQIDQQHLGNSLLSAVSLHMSANAPMTDILTLINEVRTLLADEQKVEDDEIESVRADCNEMIASFNLAIRFHASTIESLQKALQANTDLVSAAQLQLNDISNRLNTIDKMSNEENDRRTKEAESHARKMEEFDEALVTVDEAFQLVEHLKTGAAFVQLQGSFKRVNAKLEKHKAKNVLIVPLISVLSQIALKADQSAVGEILNLLGRIRSDYSGDKSEEMEGEERAIQAHNKYIEDLSDEKTKLLTKRTNIVNNIEEYKETIADTQRSMDFHNMELTKNTDGNERKKEYCRVKNDEYEKTTTYRTLDRKAVDMLSAKVKEKANALKEYLKERPDVEF